jgi:hypothetical protein
MADIKYIVIGESEQHRGFNTIKVTPHQLCSLYGVNPAECILVARNSDADIRLRGLHLSPTCITLRPLIDGRYAEKAGLLKLRECNMRGNYTVLATNKSKSSSTIHEVRLSGDKAVVYCTCRGWTNHKNCTHLDQWYAGNPARERRYPRAFPTLGQVKKNPEVYAVQPDLGPIDPDWVAEMLEDPPTKPSLVIVCRYLKEAGDWMNKHSAYENAEGEPPAAIEYKKRDTVTYAKRRSIMVISTQKGNGGSSEWVKKGAPLVPIVWVGDFEKGGYFMQISEALLSVKTADIK